MSAEREPQINIERVQSAEFDISVGPVSVRIGATELRAVSHLRPGDMPEPVKGFNPEIPVYLVDADPTKIDVATKTGFVALRNHIDVVIGRETDDQRFDLDDLVSRQHVRVQRDNKIVTITDLDSTNGTFVDTAASNIVEYSAADNQGDMAQTQSSAAVPKEQDLVVLPIIKQLEAIKNQGELYMSSGAVSLAKSVDNGVRENEDAYFADNAGLIAGVFDGVGGSLDSHIASRAASKASFEDMAAHPFVVNPDEAADLLRKTIIKADQAVKESGKRKQTTATIAQHFVDYKGGTYVAIASVGDSRAYVLSEGVLACITLDDTDELTTNPDPDQQWVDQAALAEVKSYADLNDLSPELQLAFERRHFIAKAIGSNSNLQQESEIKTYIQYVKPDDKIILTSDGVHDNLTFSEIRKHACYYEGNEELAANLAVRARSVSKHEDGPGPRDKEDDITAVVLTFHESQESASLLTW